MIQRWEYLIVTYQLGAFMPDGTTGPPGRHTFDGRAVPDINVLGAEGWEAVGYATNHGQYPSILFKRFAQRPRQ